MEVEDKKIHLLIKFYDITIKGQDKKSNVEMTNFLITNSDYNILDIPQKISILRKTYKSKYFIYECNMMGLVEFCGIRRVNKVIKMKLG
jgi:hypothetical protein